MGIRQEPDGSFSNLVGEKAIPLRSTMCVRSRPLLDWAFGGFGSRRHALDAPSARDGKRRL